MVNIFIGAILFISLSGFSFFDSNEEANELYVKASQYMHRIKKAPGSYSRAFDSYKNAKKNIETILSKYISSNLAVTLSSGETRISGFALSEFREIESPLRSLAEAEKDPLLCALLLVKTIDDEPLQAEMLTEIARKYIKAGRKEKVPQLLSQALEMLKTISNESSASKVSLLINIADSYADVGINRKASPLLAQALETAKTIKYELVQSGWLSIIASRYLKIGQFTQALETAKTIKDKYSKAETLASIAVKYTKAGQNEKAAEIRSKVLEIVENTSDESKKALALIRIANSYAMAGQNENTTHLLSYALEIVKNVSDESSKAWALIRVAGRYGMPGQNEDISRLNSERLELSKQLSGESLKVEALISIADSYAEVGQNEKSSQLLSQAFEATKSEITEESKTELLNKIVDKYIERKQFTQAFETAKTINDDGSSKAWALIGIAGKYTEAGQKPNQKNLAPQKVKTIISRFLFPRSMQPHRGYY